PIVDPAAVAARKTLVGKWRFENDAVIGTIEFRNDGMLLYKWWKAALKDPTVSEGTWNVPKAGILKMSNGRSENERICLIDSPDDLQLRELSDLPVDPPFYTMYGKL